MHWMELTQDRDRRRAPVKAAMNIRMTQNADHFLTEDVLVYLLHGVRCQCRITSLLGYW